MVVEALSGGELKVLLGDEVQVQAENSIAVVTDVDFVACKSIVHTIDTVLY